MEDDILLRWDDDVSFIVSEALNGKKIFGIENLIKSDEEVSTPTIEGSKLIPIGYW